MKYDYFSIQNELRKQSLINANSISKHLSKFAVTNNCFDSDYSSRSDFSGCIKLMFCLSFILIISCYVYGGQDIQKGFQSIYKDLSASIKKAESDYPVIEEVIGTCKKGYYYIIDKTKDLQK